ncbi:MAG: AraC family transcriptional regulator [Pseudomonas sp.]|uniref:AraC family transcriptional regulator n=1 Tax=Pseudomonas sp. TaxID=306 RepID=UPI003D6E3101
MAVHNNAGGPDYPEQAKTLRAVHHDLRSAQSWMETICGPHQLQVSSPQRLQFRHSATVLRSMSTVIGEIQYGTDVRIGIEEAQLNCFSISLPLTGEQELRLPAGTALSNINHAVIISPNMRQELTIAGNCSKLQVAIGRDVLHKVLEELLMRPVLQPLVFDATMQVNEGAAASWWRMVRFLIQEMEHSPRLLNEDPVSRDIERALIKGLILCQPSNYSCELATPSEARYPQYLRRACEFIREHAKDDVQLVDMERASGVSHSTLYDAFRRHFGMSTTQYLKHYRLQAVRQALLEGPIKQNISTIAMGCGFTHMGRFSSDYRKAFAEAPSDTLERRRDCLSSSYSAGAAKSVGGLFTECTTIVD